MRILDLVDTACRLVVGVAILVMVVSIFGQVFYRTVLDDFLGWAEETARFSFVWLVFLGSVTAFRQRRHLGIDFLPELLGPRNRVLLDTLICVLTLALMIVLARYGYQLTLRTMTQTSPAIQLTMGYVYMAVPLSAVLIALYAGVDTVRNVSALRSGDLTRAAIDPQSSIVEHAAEDGA